MELQNSRYPWTAKSPTSYIKSYNHFVNICKRHSDKLEFMWSPSGEAGAEKYYPGYKTVDIIGVSLYSFGLWDTKHIGHQRSFRELFSAKYDRLKRFKKSILIAEAGVTGDDAYQLKWVTQMVKDFKDFPPLKGIVYFNMHDRPGAWGEELGVADFKITQSNILPLLNNAYVVEKEEVISFLTSK